jgi:adenylate cyclase
MSGVPYLAANACAAALAFQRANDRLDEKFERESWPLYRTRIGLHTGGAVVGNIGSEDRMNYTALGATVNLATRLEGLNKNYGTSILVSSALKERAGPRFCFRSVDRISPKGFAEAFEIYELRCASHEGDAGDVELCRRMGAGLCRASQRAVGGRGDRTGSVSHQISGR